MILNQLCGSLYVSDTILVVLANNKQTKLT